MLMLLLLNVIVVCLLILTTTTATITTSNVYNNNWFQLNGGDSKNSNNALKDLAFNVKKDINRIIRGTKCLFEDSMEAMKLKAIQKKQVIYILKYN